MEILLVFELIIMAPGREKGDVKVLQGGYGYTRIFEIDQK